MKVKIKPEGKGYNLVSETPIDDHVLTAFRNHPDNIHALTTNRPVGHYELRLFLITDYFKTTKQPPENTVAIKNDYVDEIIKKVSMEFNIPETILVGSTRFQDVALARQAAMYLARELTDASLIRIGEHFGGRDHSTVIHACRTIERKIEKDRVFAARINTIRKDLVRKEEQISDSD